MVRREAETFRSGELRKPRPRGGEAAAWGEGQDSPRSRWCWVGGLDAQDRAVGTRQRWVWTARLCRLSREPCAPFLL